MMVSEINDGEIQPPEREMWTKKNDVTDLQETIAAYQGERHIVVPYCSSAMTLTQKVVIDEAGFSIENRPPKSAEIILTAANYFSIENGATDWNEKSWYFKNMLLNLNDAATRAITTEDGTSAKRTYQPVIEGCRFENLNAANVIVLNLKDVESASIKKNCFFTLNSTGIGMRFYNTGTRNIGNSELVKNEIFICPAAATGGIGIQVDAAAGATGGKIGNLHLKRNHYVGVQGYDSLAIDLEGDAAVTVANIHSINERFENCRILSADNVGSHDTLMFDNMEHTSPNIAASGIENVFLSAAVTRAIFKGGYSASGGSDHNDARFMHNDATGTNSAYCGIIHMRFGWVKTVDANKSYLNQDGNLWVHGCYGSDGAITDLP